MPLLDTWLVPLIVAVVGLLGGVIGARIGASSSLRLRLIDIVQDDNRAHHNFQVRAVEAVNELGLATHHMLNRRITYLRAQAAKTADSTLPRQAIVKPLEVSPAEDQRVQSATESWRSVLAEAHVFAKPGGVGALEEFDQQRHVVVSRTDEAWRHSELADVIRALELARTECDALREHHGRQVYRELQVEKAIGTVAVFDLARRRRLRRVAKQIVDATSKQIASGQQLIEDANQVRRGKSEVSPES